MKNSLEVTIRDKILTHICCFVVGMMISSMLAISLAIIMGYGWVEYQKRLTIYFGGLALDSVVLGIIFYGFVLFCYLTLHICFNQSNFKLMSTLVGYLILNYFIVLCQTLSYFILSLPMAYIIMEWTSMNLRIIFVLMLLFVCVFSFIDMMFIKIPVRFIKLCGRLFKKLNYNMDPERELNKEFNLEKIYSIGTVITTILVIGDAAGLAAFPLQGKNILNAYLESYSVALMMLFVSATLVYFKELVRGGVRKSV